MPKGVYKRTAKHRQAIAVGKRAVKKSRDLINQEPALIPHTFKNIPVKKEWETVCDLQNGALFMFHYDENNVFEKVDTVADDQDKITDVLVRRVAFRFSKPTVSPWHYVPATYIEHCNYLAEVNPVMVTLLFTPFTKTKPKLVEDENGE